MKISVKMYLKIIIPSFLFLFIIIFKPSFYETKVNSALHTNMSEVKDYSIFKNKVLNFIENKGQLNDEIKFHLKGLQHQILFYQDKIEFNRKVSNNKMNQITVSFDGANQSPEILGINELVGKFHFYTGADPNKWQKNVETYGTVKYVDLYQGVDMAYIGDDGKLESEFYVHPGSEYVDIQIKYDGITSMKIEKDGSLNIETPLGRLIEKPPYAFQIIKGVEKEVRAEYKLLAENSIGFEVGDYDKTETLVIDPELIFQATYGNSISSAWAEAVEYDSEGNIYLAGATNRFFTALDDIPESNHSGGLGNDGLLMKIDGKTGDVLFSAIFGGSKTDYFKGIALDDSNNVYLTGLTSSTDFPVLNAKQDTSAGKDDAILTIFNKNLELTKSEYFGGSDRDWGEEIGLDENNNIYIGGKTESDDLPVKGGVQMTFAGGGGSSAFPSDIFLTKFSNEGDSIYYCTYIGGSGDDKISCMDVHKSGKVFLGGISESSDYPIQNAAQPTFGGGGFGEGDAIVSLVSPEGDSLFVSTYYGGSGADEATDLGISPTGELFICGNTGSADFPVLNGVSCADSGYYGFLIKLDSAGSSIYAGCISDSNSCVGSAEGLAFDDSNNVVLVSSCYDSVKILKAKTSDNQIDFFKSFQKSDTPEIPKMDLAGVFTFSFTGISINDIALSSNGNYIALAGTFEDPESPFSDPKAALAEMIIDESKPNGTSELDEYYEFKLDSVINWLDITLLKPNPSGTVLEFDSNGYLSINGIPTLYKDLESITIYGTSGNDIINCSKLKEKDFKGFTEYRVQINAGDGDDNITGSQAKDYIFGEDGNDEILSADGNDRVYAGNGNDIIDGGYGDDILDGGKGDDNVSGGDGNDVIFGSFNHIENGYDDKDKLYGDDGNDVIEFTPKALVLDGGSGRDKFKLISKNSNKNLTTLNFKSSLLDNPGIIISDTTGIDTLDFSGLDTGIKFNLSLQDVPQEIDDSGTVVTLKGEFEIFYATNYNDVITTKPLIEDERSIEGGDGTDTLYFTTEIEASDNGSVLTTDGFSNVNYSNIEKVVLTDFGNPTDIFNLLNPNEDFTYHIYPNPFFSTVTLSVELNKTSDLSIDIYDNLGRKVMVLLNKTNLLPGKYSYTWNGYTDMGKKINHGIYYYMIKLNNKTINEKIVFQ